jgi:hypothetical protein
VALSREASLALYSCFSLCIQHPPDDDWSGQPKHVVLYNNRLIHYIRMVVNGRIINALSSVLFYFWGMFHVTNFYLPTSRTAVFHPRCPLMHTNLRITDVGKFALQPLKELSVQKLTDLKPIYLLHYRTFLDFFKIIFVQNNYCMEFVFHSLRPVQFHNRYFTKISKSPKTAEETVLKSLIMLFWWLLEEWGAAII